MNTRKILLNFGLNSISFYRYKGCLHIFFDNPNVRGRDVADCLQIPVYINGVKYNWPGHKKPL